ncbi:hypothetical protein LEMLEM_LOCUS10171 [Lemmus lemmus]
MTTFYYHTENQDSQNEEFGGFRDGQKRAPDLITDGCEPPCGCRELNPGPPEEQAMLSTTEPSLQPPSYVLNPPFSPKI